MRRHVNVYLSLGMIACLIGFLGACGGPKYPPGEIPADTSDETSDDSPVQNPSSDVSTSSRQDQTIVTLDSSCSKLIEAFNATTSKKRLLMVLSPT